MAKVASNWCGLIMWIGPAAVLRQNRRNFQNHFTIFCQTKLCTWVICDFSTNWPNFACLQIFASHYVFPVHISTNFVFVDVDLRHFSQSKLPRNFIRFHCWLLDRFRQKCNECFTLGNIFVSMFSAQWIQKKIWRLLLFQNTFSRIGIFVRNDCDICPTWVGSSIVCFTYTRQEMNTKWMVCERVRKS